MCTENPKLKLCKRKGLMFHWMLSAFQMEGIICLSLFWILPSDSIIPYFKIKWTLHLLFGENDFYVHRQETWGKFRIWIVIPCRITHRFSEPWLLCLLSFTGPKGILFLLRWPTLNLWPAHATIASNLFSDFNLTVLQDVQSKLHLKYFSTYHHLLYSWLSFHKHCYSITYFAIFLFKSTFVFSLANSRPKEKKIHSSSKLHEQIQKFLSFLIFFRNVSGENT